METVILIKDQQCNIKKFNTILHPQEPIFVFDRCTIYDTKRSVVNNDGEGFLAGRMRNLGANGIDDAILFLDGDKIPSKNPYPCIERLSKDYDCILFGVENDIRTWFVGEGPLPWSNYRNPNNGVFSCGIWLSKKAVRYIRSLNDGDIFRKEFDGYWGEEDRFLGDQLVAGGFKIGYTTEVILSGKYSDFDKKEDDFYRNFLIRLELRNNLFKF